MTYTGEVESRAGPADVREVPGLTITKVCHEPVQQQLLPAALTARPGTPCWSTPPATRRGAARAPGRRQPRRIVDDSRALGPPAGPARRSSRRPARRCSPRRTTRASCRSRSTGFSRTATRSGSTDCPSTSPWCAATPRVRGADLQPTPGPDHVFTGDTLFPGGVGENEKDSRTVLPAAHRRRRAAHLRPARRHAWVYPGHGDDTTLGAERPHLAAWRERGW